MYLVLRPPWGGGGDDDVVVDAGVASAERADGGVKKKGGKKGGKGGKRRGNGGNGGVPEHAMTIDEAFAGGDDEPVEAGPPLIQVPSSELANVTRGQAAVGPSKVDMSSNTESRSLNGDEINSVIRSQAGGIRDCVVKIATNTSLKAITVEVKLAVDGSGKVTSYAVTGPKYMQDHGLYDCVGRAAARIKFAAVGGSTLVDFPVQLN